MLTVAYINEDSYLVCRPIKITYDICDIMIHILSYNIYFNTNNYMRIVQGVGIKVHIYIANDNHNVNRHSNIAVESGIQEMYINIV